MKSSKKSSEEPTSASVSRSMNAELASASGSTISAPLTKDPVVTTSNPAPPTEIKPTEVSPTAAQREVITTTHSADPEAGAGKILTSRKFILTILSLISGFWLAISDKDVSGYAMLSTGVLAAYFGANVGQDYVFRKTRQSRYNEDLSPDVGRRDLSDLRRRD